MSLASASVSQAYEMMLRGRPLEMALLAMAFYGVALLKKERDLSFPTSLLEQMCALFEAQDDTRKSKGDAQLWVLCASDAHGV